MSKIFVLLACIVLPAKAAETTPVESVDALAKSIQEAMETTETLYAPFKQIKTVSELPIPLEAYGQLMIKPPGSVRLEFLEPFQSVTIRTEAGIAKYEKQESWTRLKTSDSRMLDIFFNQLFGWFSGDFESSRKVFTPELLQEDAGVLLVLHSQPERLRKSIQQIEIRICTKTFAFQSIAIIASNGDKSLMEFFDEQRNIPMPQGLFNVNREEPLAFNPEALP